MSRKSDKDGEGLRVLYETVGGFEYVECDQETIKKEKDGHRQIFVRVVTWVMGSFGRKGGK